jgi:hypothetical protein
MFKKRHMEILTMFVMLMTLCVHVQAAPVPDTGQTTCYNADGNVIICPSPGQLFYGQDGNYSINQPSYTKLDADGNDLPDSALSWAMVRDNVTGLIWEEKTDDGSIHDKLNTYNWYYAGDEFVEVLNSTVFGGFDDWRLPTIKELAYLVEFSGSTPPYINTNYFANLPSPVTDYYFPTYWSCDTDASDTEKAFSITFEIGTDRSALKGGLLFVRAVRGAQSINSFVDNGDGTISDTATGLMWEKDTARDELGNYARMSWEDALAYCEKLPLPNNNPYADWRLPNLKELRNLVAYGEYAPSIDKLFFPNTDGSYWTSTTSVLLPERAWMTFFGENGTSSYADKSYNQYASSYVRCVRSGQGGSSDTISPSTITNLSASTGAAPGSVDLSWTATGDDGNSGTADHYEIKYFSQNITSSNWAQATTYSQSWSPKSAGSAESYAVTGLTPGQTYYFALRAVDEAGNKGDISNSTSAKAGAEQPPSPDKLEIVEIDLYVGYDWQDGIGASNPYTTRDSDYALPYAQANRDKIRVVVKIKNVTDTDMEGVRIKATFERPDENKTGTSTMDLFETLSNEEAVDIPSNGEVTVYLPWREVASAFLGSVEEFAGYDMSIRVSEGSKDFFELRKFTGAREENEYDYGNDKIVFHGWDHTGAYIIAYPESPYILFIVNYQNWAFRSFCDSYELNPPVEDLMIKAEGCLSGIWDEYVEKDSNYEDDVRDVHVFRPILEFKKVWDAMGRIKSMLTGGAGTTLEESNKAVDAISNGISCLINSEKALKYKTDVETCYRKWDDCFDCQCKKNGDDTSSECEINEESKVEYRKRMYEQQIWPYEEEVQCMECDCDNSWWSLSRDINYFFLRSDEPLTETVKMDPLTQLGFQGAVKVEANNGAKGLLIGEKNVTASSYDDFRASLSATVFSFIVPVTKLSIYLSDFGGDTTLKAYDKNGTLLKTLSIAGAEPQKYTIEGVGEISKIIISSTSGWVGQLTYSICNTNSCTTIYVDKNDETCGGKSPCVNTIQTAVDAALDGNTVLVADGTYAGEGNKDIDFKGKAITVKCMNGPGNCIIDCEQNGRGFYLHSGEAEASVISGFNIINGNVSGSDKEYGGGIYCEGSPTIESCIISGNTASGEGYWGYGYGGGIYCVGSPNITDCTISGNTASGDGYKGGYGMGGGIYCDGAPSITSCAIEGNNLIGGLGTTHGNGVYCTGAATITNTTITGNTSFSSYAYGGGIYCPGSATILNSTISGNSADEGGGVHCSSSMTVINSIIYGNSPNEFFSSDGTPNVTYSDIQGGFSGSGNINANPLFVGSGDYHLTGSSPCINTGHNNASGLPSTDKDGNLRIIGETVDMGAYEAALFVYVDKEGSCGGKNPCFSSIQAAIDAVGTGIIIRIAQGNYPESIALNASKSLILQGGFNSTFTAQTPNTTFIKAPKAPQGSLTLQMVTVKP